MSRGFVKEADYKEPVLERTTHSAITAHGLAALERQLAATGDAAAQAALERRIASSFVPEPPSDRRVVAFGATVRVSGAAAAERTFTIVGEDEIDVACGLIGATSPLAQALLGACVGDVVIWHRPASDLAIGVSSVAYEKQGLGFARDDALNGFAHEGSVERRDAANKLRDARDR